MITPAYVQAMAAYNAEMNRRVYASAGRLDEGERLADRGAHWRSIQGTLCHLLWADRMWLARFGFGAPPGARLADSAGVIGDFDRLWTERQAQDAVISDWAAAITPADLAGDLVWYSGAMGRDMRRPRALCVAHLFNHQTHHRGQVHALLTAQGETTGATDLPFVLD